MGLGLVSDGKGGFKGLEAGLGLLSKFVVGWLVSSRSVLGIWWV